MVAIHKKVEMYERSGDKAVKYVHFGLYMEQQYHAGDLTNWYDSSEDSCLRLINVCLCINFIMNKGIYCTVHLIRYKYLGSQINL